MSRFKSLIETIHKNDEKFHFEPGTTYHGFDNLRHGYAGDAFIRKYVPIINGLMRYQLLCMILEGTYEQIK